jgi:hypothetical protein
MTRVREPPPTEECPSDASPVFGFCGPTCGDCPDIETSPSLSYQGCVGLNGERGVGLCTHSQACSAGDRILEADASEVFWDGTDPTACLVQRDPVTGEYWEWGWTVSVPACTAYRALYPESFDCRDVDWETIP